MSEDNSIQPQEDKLISQAKKRLLGASVILFILLISAPFVLKNRNEEGPTEPIKISMESSPEIVDVNVESIKLPETKQEIPESSGSQIKKEAVILPSSGMYIQFGIFSDNEKIYINGSIGIRLQWLFRPSGFRSIRRARRHHLGYSQQKNV